MVKVNIISGFLGAGKTTLIKKLLQAKAEGEKVILLENEYGDVGVDGAFMKDTGIVVDELNSGCICCTLVGDFQKAVDELIVKYQPDRLIIEPSGVGKLSEIVSAVDKCKQKHPEMEIAGCATVVDAGKCRMHMKNFGEFFLDQVKTADTIIFSRTQMLTPERVEKSRALIDEAHPGARVITTPWDDLTAAVMLEVVESGRPIEIHVEHEHHDHDHDEHEHHHEHDEHCGCGCHDDDHDEHEHHHEHDEHCNCHDDDHEHEHHHDHDEHEHHHEHDEHCDCGCHDHDHEHHHHHHADEVFVSVGWETAKRFEQADIAARLNQLSDEEEYGNVLRAKGMLQNTAGDWFQFDYVPGESQFRAGSPDYTGRICVIGAHIDEKALKELWGV
ncbi:MAG: CobW family GTP-binding protein [Aristaeellaceae bacterium]